MRRLTALVFAAILLAGCASEDPDPGTPTESTSTGPEDTIDVLGAWTAEPLDESSGALTLTLSDDNSYSITDACIELPGRWALEGGRVLLTPSEDGIVQCDPDADLPDLPDELVVQGDQLVPEGDGPTFSR